MAPDHDLARWLSQGLASVVRNVFVFRDKNEREYYPYVVSCLFFAWIVYCGLPKYESGRAPAAGTQLEGTTKFGRFAEFIFPRAVYNRHAWVDVWVWLFNIVLVSFLFGPALLSVPEVAASGVEWLLAPVLAHIKPSSDAVTSACVAAVLNVLLADFGFFVWHVLNHRVPLLWEFHKVHHSAQALTPVTQYRFHPVDMLGVLVVIQICRIPAIAYASAVAPSARPQFEQLSDLLTAVMLGAAGLCGILRHSHIWLPYPKALSRVLSSPAMHQVHHGTNPRYFDTNYGLVFSIWDTILGTNYIPDPSEKFSVGLTEEDGRNTFGEKDASFSALLWRPLVMAARRFRPARAPDPLRSEQVAPD